MTKTEIAAAINGLAMTIPSGLIGKPPGQDPGAKCFYLFGGLFFEHFVVFFALVVLFTRYDNGYTHFAELACDVGVIRVKLE